MYYDSTIILVIIPMIFTLIVQASLKSTFSKYQNVQSKSGLTASEACEKILHASGVDNVKIGRVAGDLTDHYAPLKKELNLSDSTHNSRSIASIGVAAHEAGHAVQDHEAMALLKFQMRIVPVVNFMSKASIPILLIGMLLNAFGLMQLGIYLFAGTLVYQLITLPIEFDASNRAVKNLRATGLMDEEELIGVKKVLKAAALTYVAAAATTIMQLLRFIIIANNGRRRN